MSPLNTEHTKHVHSTITEREREREREEGGRGREERKREKRVCAQPRPANLDARATFPISATAEYTRVEYCQFGVQLFCLGPRVGIVPTVVRGRIFATRVYHGNYYDKLRRSNWTSELLLYT